MTTQQIYSKANKMYPMVGPNPPVAERNAYVRGYLDAIDELTKEDGNFYEKVAEGLRKLWPSGEKDGKYAWKDSVQNLVRRLEFIWQDRGLKDKYTVDDCLMAARRYLAQYEDNVKYMQTLKYFVFKQTKLVARDGKVTYTYKSTFADMLESNPTNISSEFDELFETSDTFSQGDLI